MPAVRVYRGARQLTGATPLRGAPAQPRTRKMSAKKAARLAEIEAAAVPGRKIIRSHEARGPD